MEKKIKKAKVIKKAKTKTPDPSAPNKEKSAVESPKVVSLQQKREISSVSYSGQSAKQEKQEVSAYTTIINTMERTMSKKPQAIDKAAFDKITKETAEFTREYSEACAKAGTIFMKGLEDITGQMMAMAQSSAEKQAKFAKEAMSIKTINEFAEVQNKIAQASFDDFMSGFTKISEMSVKVLTEGTEPVNAQISKAIQRATESIAA